MASSLLPAAIDERARRSDLAIIHILAREAKLDRTRYEQLLYRLTHEISASGLDALDRARVIRALEQLVEARAC